MVVDGVSSDAGDAVSSSWANADVMKLRAAMPINDVISFIWFSFRDVRENAGWRRNLVSHSDAQRAQLALNPHSFAGVYQDCCRRVKIHGEARIECFRLFICSPQDAPGNRWTKSAAQIKRPHGESAPVRRNFMSSPWAIHPISSMRRKTKKRLRVAKPKTKKRDRVAKLQTKRRAGVAIPKRRQFSGPPQLEPGAPSDLDLMLAIQASDPDALSQLYDRYNGILKALILRVVHNDAEADDLLQEIFMEIWNQAKNFSAQKGKPLGWMVTLARRRAIDGLRKKQAYARAEERLQNETEQQPDAWVHNATEEAIV